MMILVRALILEQDNPSSMYVIHGKTFKLGTPINVIREYADSLIQDNLSALEIKLISNTDNLVPGIDCECLKGGDKA